MRTIEFRGKRIDNGEWVYGDLFRAIKFGNPSVFLGGMCIQAETPDGVRSIDIDPETIGQFTGFFDKKGTKIYEGDIITYIRQLLDGTGILEQGKVEWSQEEGRYVFVDRILTKDNREIVTPLIRCKNIRVIGNIHDQPELMKGAEP